MVVVFLLAGIPIYRLTLPAAADAAIGSGEASTAEDSAGVKPGPLDLEAVFAPAPADFQIKNLDQTVLAGQGPQVRYMTRWITAVPPEGVDLVIQAHWMGLVAGGNPAATSSPGANPAAVRIRVHFSDGRQVEKSFWAAADGTLSEVFTLPGGTPAAAP